MRLTVFGERRGAERLDAPAAGLQRVRLDQLALAIAETEEAAREGALRAALATVEALAAVPGRPVHAWLSAAWIARADIAQRRLQEAGAAVVDVMTALDAQSIERRARALSPNAVVVLLGAPVRSAVTPSFEILVGAAPAAGGVDLYLPRGSAPVLLRFAAALAGRLRTV